MKNFFGRTRREFLWQAGAGFTGVAKESQRKRLQYFRLLALNHLSEFMYLD